MRGLPCCAGPFLSEQVGFGKLARTLLGRTLAETRRDRILVSSSESVKWSFDMSNFTKSFRRARHHDV